MTDGDRLLRQVLTTPQDDTVRLVYADWLDENDGDREHAEFIRLCLRPSKATRSRRTYLSSKLRRKWLRELQPGKVSPHFRITDANRGFAVGIRMLLPDFMKVCRTVFSRHPISLVVPVDRGPLRRWLEGETEDDPDEYAYCWRRDASGRLRHAWQLPAVVFDGFPREVGHPLNRKGQVGFSSVVAAGFCLSMKLVDHGRRTAGLPPWPGTQSPAAGTDD
jgi:uncharacterized protein (TIGR02996 family)